MHIIYFPPGGWEGRPGRPHTGKRGPPFPGIYHWLAVAGGLLLLFGDIAAPKLPIHVTLSYPNKFRGWNNFFDLLLMLYLGWIGVSSQPLKKELTQQPHMSVAAHFPVCSPIATSISVLCLLQKPIAEAAIHAPKNPLLSLSTCPSTFSLRENVFLLEQICAPCGGFPGLSTVSACPAPPRASSVSLSIHTCKHLLSPRQALFSHLPASGSKASPHGPWLPGVEAAPQASRASRPRGWQLCQLRLHLRATQSKPASRQLRELGSAAFLVTQKSISSWYQTCSI